MANVRSFDAVDDQITLGGSGTGNFDLTVLWVGKLANAPSATARCLLSIGTGTATTICAIYYTTGLVLFGSSPGDSQVSFSLNTTDWFMIAITKIGTGTPRFHIKNLTTGAAATHSNGNTSVGQTGTNWTSSHFNRFSDGGGFAGQRAVAGAAWTEAINDSEFDTLAAAASTQSLLTGLPTSPPTRVWELDQASIATDVNNEITSTDDQTAITGTTVVTDTPPWTFLGGTTAIGESLGMKWDTAAVIGESLGMKWDTAALIGESLSLKWDTAIAAGESLALKWDTAALIGESLAMPWDVTAIIGESLAMPWDVSSVGAIGESLAMPWDVTALIGESLAMPWETLVSVGESLGLKWDTQVFVGESLGLKWDTTSLIGESLTVRWTLGDVAASGRSPYRRRSHIRPHRSSV